jgi:hypothetical protein
VSPNTGIRYPGRTMTAAPIRVSLPPRGPGGSVGPADEVEAQAFAGEILTIGSPVCISSTRTMIKAFAADTSRILVAGFWEEPVSEIGRIGHYVSAGTLSASIYQWAPICGQNGGLTPGSLYFLDPSAPGRITTSAPSASGLFVVELGLAISSTDLEISIQPPIML